MARGKRRERVRDLAVKQPSVGIVIHPAVAPLYLASKSPDLKKGDVKDKLEGYWEEIHPSSKLESPETRGRYRRRVGGAAVGAVGGFITGGPVGAGIGAGIGASRAKKGRGQTDDYAGTFALGLAAGYAWNSVSTSYNAGGLSGVWTAVKDIVSKLTTALGLYDAYAASKGKPKEGTPGGGGGGGGMAEARGIDEKGNTFPVNKKAEKVDWTGLTGVLVIAGVAFIILGGK